MEILDNLPYDLTVQDVMNEMKMRNIPPKIKTLIEEVFNTLTEIARPKAVYDVSYIDKIENDRIIINGVEFKSKLLAINLKNINRVFPHVVTVGREADSVEVDKSDFMRDYIVDVVKEMILRRAKEYFESYILDKYGIEKVSYMSPGSLSDWPIEQQKPLFQLLGDVTGAIGVELMPSYIMKPVKSVSGIYFPTKVDFKSCMLCPRKNCPSRKAEFNPEMYEKYIKQG